MKQEKNLTNKQLISLSRTSVMLEEFAGSRSVRHLMSSRDRQEFREFMVVNHAQQRLKIMSDPKQYLCDVFGRWESLVDTSTLPRPTFCRLQSDYRINRTACATRRWGDIFYLYNLFRPVRGLPLTLQERAIARRIGHRVNLNETLTIINNSRIIGGRNERA